MEEKINAINNINDKVLTYLNNGINTYSQYNVLTALPLSLRIKMFFMTLKLKATKRRVIKLKQQLNTL